MKEFNNILFPIDFSECSKKVFPYARDLAKNLDAKLYLLFVAHDISYLTTIEVSRDTLMNTVAEIARAGEEQIQAFCDKELSDFPNHEGKVVTGNPAEKIVEFVGEKGIDMIVMGTHGRTGLDRTLMGSVADHVIKNAPVPVVTINPYRLKA